MAEIQDEVIAFWDRQIKLGVKTYKDMADELDLCSRQAARGKLRRWRSNREITWQAQAQPSAQQSEQVQLPVERSKLVEQLLDSLISVQDELQNLDDTQPVITIRSSDKLPIMKVMFADTHIGGTGVDHRQMREDMELVRDTDGVEAFHLGDVADNYHPNHHPSAMLHQLTGPELQWELASMFLEKYLGPNLDGVVGGNHDGFSGDAGLNPLRELCRRLKVPYLGPGGRVWLHLGEQVYKLELRHYFNFNSSLNTTNSQRRLSELTLGADVVAFGHLHYPDMQFVWRGGVNQIWLRSSTYKRRDPWAEAKNLQISYAPPPADMAGVIFFPDRHWMIPFRRFQDGLPLLKILRSDGN